MSYYGKSKGTFGKGLIWILWSPTEVSDVYLNFTGPGDTNHRMASDQFIPQVEAEAWSLHLCLEGWLSAQLQCVLIFCTESLEDPALSDCLLSSK